MSDTQISFGRTVSLEEGANLLKALGHRNRFLLRGEPGIGKSSILSYLQSQMGDEYNYTYFDCMNKDLGDIVMPAINRETRQTEYFPNAAFNLTNGKPSVIMLDEFTKAPQPIQNMLHPLLEVVNPRLGDQPLHPDRIVFLTGNMGGDNVGDNLKAHTIGRLTTVTVRKSTADEWLGWAVNRDINPVVMAWVNQFPHCMDSYMDGNSESNPYIYNPKKVQGAYVSPRSLQLASNIIDARGMLSPNAALSALIGTIGESGARDMNAYVDFQDQLPSWESIIDKPDKAKIPEAPGACAVMVFGAVTKVDNKTISPFMEYIERMDAEWQAIFAVNIAKNPAKQQTAFTSSKFRDWVLANEDIL